MNEVLKTINEKGAKLSRWQTYTILFILASAVILLPAYTITTNYLTSKREIVNNYDKEIISKEMVSLLRDMNSNIVELNTTVKNNNLNNVTKEAASTIYEKTFQQSKFKIIELVMFTIANNHIDNIDRRKVITKTFQVSIYNMYTDDYDKLSTFKFKDKRLNEPLDKIDPQIVIDELLRILFNEHELHEQRRQDAMQYLDNKFNQFYQQSINSI